MPKLYKFRDNGVLLVYVGDNFVHTAYLKCRNYVPILRFSCHRRHQWCENIVEDMWSCSMMEIIVVTPRMWCFGHRVSPLFYVVSDDVTQRYQTVSCIRTHGLFLLFRNYKTWAEIHLHNVRRAHTVKIVSTLLICYLLIFCESLLLVNNNTVKLPCYPDRGYRQW